MKSNKTSISLHRNSFNLLYTEYIESDRSIEIILVNANQGNNEDKLLYLYNYRGIHFIIFSNLIELSSFLQGKDSEILAEFEKDEDVDKFLFTAEINQI